MKIKILIVFFLTYVSTLFAQVDYSNNWQDFYSYNNVKDFVKVNSVIYAVVDNAVFTYNTSTNEITKLSSVNGLSGETTTSIYYSQTYEKLIIGYENGALEIVDNEGNITIANDIANFDITGEKSINHIYEYANKLYLSTAFAVVEYNIENLVFGDTFFIGPASSSIYVNQTTVFNDKIYAATENGIFIANINDPFLIDFNNWQQFFTGNYPAIVVFDNKVYTTRFRAIYSITPAYTLTFHGNQTNTVIDLKSNNNYLTVSMQPKVNVLDTSLNSVAEVVVDTASEYNFTTNTAFAESNTIYTATQEFGILQSTFTSPQTFTEIHPDGPSSNKLFSITAQNEHLWVVYGGYDDAYTPLNNKFGYSHFSEGSWANIPYDSNFPAKSLVHITMDPNNNDKAYLSSWSQGNITNEESGGILVVENNEPTEFLNHTNSGLETIVLSAFPSYISVRINGTTFDDQGNLWVANAWVDNRLKKRSPTGAWSSYDLSTLISNSALGLNDLAIDKSNNKWIGTRRNGALIYNENGDRKRALTSEATKGSLPDLNVRTIAVDDNNRVWLGTKKGLVVYNNPSGVFDADIYDAEPIIILDDGIPKKLMGDQVINTIEVDGANNKWIGSENGGVVFTNPTGRETLEIFNKDNSPLPSNTILKIQVDDSTGTVYFGTDKGIVAYNSSVVPFGKELGEVYAFPNPVLKNHKFVTIDGRNGTHLPEGTNVKILDSAGSLVYETNVVEGQEINGGKVVWNKRNLAGRKVASGVYIVLLTANENQETSMTKIAIIN